MAIVKKTTVKPATKKTATKSNVKKSNTKSAVKNQAVKSTSKANRNDDKMLSLVSIIRLLLEVFKADGNVVESEVNFLVGVVKGFGVTNPLVIGQLLSMGRKMSLTAAIKHVSSFTEEQKKLMASMIFAAARSDKMVTASEVHALPEIEKNANYLFLKSNSKNTLWQN
ncbi:MAG: TerB family tellurite resistance protein [Prevotellaceae bacterium]|nr:TerB family tellurite resistance protein [Candidatus Faecinaster equi]